MTIFDALLDSHETQRTLLDLLVKTSGESQGRNELLERVRIELETHAAAEERFFYVPLMQDGATQEQARHSVHEHEQLDDLLAELDDKDMSSSGWLVTAKSLREKVVHHLDEEEEDVFPAAREVLTKTQQEELGASYVGLVNELKSGSSDPMSEGRKDEQD